MDGSLSRDLARRIDAYWRAANDLPVARIYRYDNPLLHEALAQSEAAFARALGDDARAELRLRAPNRHGRPKRSRPLPLGRGRRRSSPGTAGASRGREPMGTRVVD